MSEGKIHTVDIHLDAVYFEARLLVTRMGID